MMLLAIDPGPEKSAYVTWRDGRILGHGIVSNDVMLNFVMGSQPPLGLSDPPQYCVIEMIASYGMPVGREVFETCVWIGMFMQAFGRHRCSRLTRIEVKNHLCHSSRAKDANIRQALIDRLGAPGTKKAPGPTYGIVADEWAALAVAVTWYDQQGKL